MILENSTVAVRLFSLPMSENMEVVVSGLSLADMHFLWHKYVSNAGLQGVPKPKNVIILGMAASPKSIMRFCSLTGLRPPSKPQNCSLQRVSYDILISKNGVSMCIMDTCLWGFAGSNKPRNIPLLVAIAKSTSCPPPRPSAISSHCKGTRRLFPAGLFRLMFPYRFRGLCGIRKRNNL